MGTTDYDSDDRNLIAGVGRTDEEVDCVILDTRDMYEQEVVEVRGSDDYNRNRYTPVLAVCTRIEVVLVLVVDLYFVDYSDKDVYYWTLNDL